MSKIGIDVLEPAAILLISLPKNITPAKKDANEKKTQLHSK